MAFCKIQTPFVLFAFFKTFLGGLQSEKMTVNATNDDSNSSISHTRQTRGLLDYYIGAVALSKKPFGTRV